ncbi:hypothetical protein [Pelorhabdus rhamnosifermentans]|nr:hypothetical protein [Pelorhabdus rhamnosifermentans]
MKEINQINFNADKAFNLTDEQKETAKSIIAVIENSGKPLKNLATF